MALNAKSQKDATEKLLLMPNFSENLNSAWRISGIKKGEIAKSLGVEGSTVSRWFAGAIPSQAYLSGLANLFGVSEQFLLYGSDDKMPKTPGSRVSELANKDEYRTKNDDTGGEMRGLVEDFIDRVPQETIIKMLHAFGGELVSGNIDAAKKSRILIEMIRKRRPEIFKDDQN